MKRTFTFSMSRKVSTAQYENADVFAAEGVEADPGTDMTDANFAKESAAIIARVRRLVDELADSLRGA